LYTDSPGGGLALGLQIVPWMGMVTVMWRLKIFGNKRYLGNGAR